MAIALRTQRTRTQILTAAFASVALAGCTSTTYASKELTNVSIPVRDTVPKPKAPALVRESPPESGPARQYKFPAVVWAELPNGLKVATIVSKALPIVQVRVAVLAGKSADGEAPGIASISGDLLKDGGAGGLSSKDLITKVESLGASLSIDTGFDKTVLGLAVTKDRLEDAMSILGTVVAQPMMNAQEFAKLKKRELDRVADAARTSGQWSASMMMYRDLFALPSDHHPYASYDATVPELQKLTLESCRAFHKRYYVPRNAFVVVAGDVTPQDAKAAAEKAFKGWKGGDPPAIPFTDPLPPDGLKITLVDRPKSSQSDVFVGMIGPLRADHAWASFAVANQVLGGGVSGRLFLDVREKQSLAYNTRSTLRELAHGPAPLVAYAGTQTAKTGLALKGLLDNLDKIGGAAPEDDEIRMATRYLSDVFAIKLETIGALADELVGLHTLGLPDDYDDGYRKQLREVTGALALKAASEHVRAGHAVVVVAGDASVIGPMLSHFGEVKVLDPMKNFERSRTIPMNADAPLEIPRAEGK